jgi:hypothetical protein
MQGICDTGSFHGFYVAAPQSDCGMTYRYGFKVYEINREPNNFLEPTT